MLTQIDLPEVTKVTPFVNPEGSALASVTIRFGPMAVRAKLIKKEDNSIFLALPSRKLDNDEGWFDYVVIYDQRIVNILTEQAVERFRNHQVKVSPN